MDNSHTFVTDFIQPLSGRIGAPVVDENYFIGSINTGQGIVERFEEWRKILTFVEEWHDNRDFGRALFETVHFYFGMFLRPVKTKE